MSDFTDAMLQMFTPPDPVNPDPKIPPLSGAMYPPAQTDYKQFYGPQPPQAPPPAVKPPPATGDVMAQAIAPQQPQQDVFAQALQQYPVLANQGLQYKNSPGRGKGFLEFWPPGETGAPDMPRPTEFDINKPGVEVYDPKTRPIDVLGDVVSHHMVNTDPKIKSTYQNFVASMTPEQHTRLQEQYAHAQKNEGEERAFEEWKQMSGLPAYFRGYPFEQWDNAAEMYTPQQRANLDAMMSYLRGQPGR